MLLTIFISILSMIVLILLLSVKVISQSNAYIVERFGKYHATLVAGLHIVLPVIYRIRARIDLRERIVSFGPQSVITKDNLVVSVDSIIYFQVIDPKAAVYEISNYIKGIEQITITTLRNIVGGLDLETVLVSRDRINTELRKTLDITVEKWGVRSNRVEIKSINPPKTIQEAMEKQMRAERDKRASILTAEGVKEPLILKAEGEQKSTILQAEGDAKAKTLRAEAESSAISTVYSTIHNLKIDNKVLMYKYISTLPELANGSSNKVWMLDSNFSKILASISESLGNKDEG